MKTLLIGFVIFVIFCLFIGFWIMGIYNSFVSQNENIDAQWANVETNYQRRFDLIPNLVNATKGFLKQEQKVFGDIAEARTKYAGAAPNSPEKVEAANGLEGALARLLVIVENYPELKSDKTVAALMDELAGTENRINVERQRYNEVVRKYNISVKRFPRNVLAGMFSFEERKLFEADKEAEKAPTVNLE